MKTIEDFCIYFHQWYWSLIFFFVIFFSSFVLECEVKWALGSITTNKASGGDGIPAWAISNPKRWRCESVALNRPANLENSAVATGLQKVSFHSNPKERQCQKCSNYCTIELISHTSKVMLKILQARLQQYVNRELPDVRAGFTPLSMGFSRQGYWSGLPCPPPWDLPDPGIKPKSLMSPVVVLYH